MRREQLWQRRLVTSHALSVAYVSPETVVSIVRAKRLPEMRRCGAKAAILRNLKGKVAQSQSMERGMMKLVGWAKGEGQVEITI